MYAVKFNFKYFVCTHVARERATKERLLELKIRGVFDGFYI